MRSSSPIETEYSIITTTKGTTSPLNFLYPIMPSLSSSPTRTHHQSSSASTSQPHSHSLNHAHHSPGGKRSARKKEREQQEIARLLDPSYQGGEGHHHHHQTTARRSLEVYVDKDGDLHDPDFRYFPSAETFVSRTRNVPERKRRATSPRRGEAMMRPYWDRSQLEVEDALADEEEEEELLAQELGVNDFLARAGYGNGTSSEYSPRSRSARSRRDGASYRPAYTGYSSGYSYSPPFNSHSTSTTTTTTTATTTSYYSPAMTTTTLPTSCESENTVLSSSAEDGEKECGVKGLLAAAKRRRRLSKGEKEKKEEVKEASRRSIEATRTSVLEPTREEDSCHPQPELTSERDLVDTPSPDDDNEQHDAEDAEDIEFIESHSEYVPTCTEVLKRHWLSISLRFRFGVYRAQRRFVRRVHSMF